MRVISQDGMVDLPYENIGISINHHSTTDIIAYPACNYSSDSEFWIMALYSTEAKAQKAMEMLRAAYTGTPLIFENCDVADEVFEELKRRSIEAILTVTNDKPKVGYLDNFYFQFPKDKDLEV